MEFELKKEQKKFLRKMYKGAGKLAGNVRLPPLRFEERTIVLSNDILKELFRIGFLAVQVKDDRILHSRTGQEPVQERGIRKESECFLHCYTFEANVPIKLRECEKGIEVEDIKKMDGKAIRKELYRELLSYNPEFYNAYGKGGYIGPRTWHATGETEDYTILQPVVRASDVTGEPGVLFIHTHPHSLKDYMQQSFIARLFRMAPCLLPESLSDGDLSAMVHSESPYYHGVMGAFSLELGVFMGKVREKIKELGETIFHQEGDKIGFLKFEYIREIAKESANACANEKSLEVLYEKRGMPLVIARYEPESDVIAVYTKLKVT